MIGKTTAVIVLLAALALGTASATSLGTFDDVSFAASDVDLLNCAVVDDAIQLIPDLDADLATLTTLGVDSFTLDEIVIDIPTACVGKVADVVLIGASGVLETLVGTTTETGIIFPDIVVETVQTDLHSRTDIGAIEDIRIVVRDA